VPNFLLKINKVIGQLVLGLTEGKNV